MPINFQERSNDSTCIMMNDEVGLCSGVGSPWTEFVNVPQGSRYFKSDGTEWLKSSQGDLEENWEQIIIPTLSAIEASLFVPDLVDINVSVFVGHNINANPVMVSGKHVYNHNTFESIDLKPGKYLVKCNYNWSVDSNKGGFDGRLHSKIGDLAPWVLNQEHTETTKKHQTDNIPSQLTAVIELTQISDLTLSFSFTNLDSKKKSTVYQSLITLQKLE